MHGHMDVKFFKSTLYVTTFFQEWKVMSKTAYLTGLDKQYKIIPSNTSLLLSDLRSGYMFRYHVPSSGLNIKIT
jgi:hypothetical protein